MAKPPGVALSAHNAKVSAPATASNEERVASSAQAGPNPNSMHSQHRPRRSQPVTVAMLNDVRTMFHSLLNEFAYFIDPTWVTGTIPPELNGTYYRNGPGLQVSNPRYQRHTLDGDGMVFSLAFKDGQAFFRNRFVRTEGFKAEQKAGRPLFRNSFTRGAVDGSMNFNPFDLRFKNVANTGVLPWGGQLYALWEAGLPYLMDPVTLDTVRETRMGGQIRTNTFAAHYRIVTEQHQQQHHHHHSAGGSSTKGSGAGAGAQAAASTSSTASTTAGTSKRLVTFSNEFGFTGAKAVFYEFDEAGKLIHETEHTLQGVDVALIHDMIVTEHYYVLICGPIALQPVKFATQYMLGRCSIAECLVFDSSKPTRIMMFPRPGRPSGKVLAPRIVESPEPFFVFHNVNGYEAEDGQVLVMDVVAWDEVSFEMDLYDKDSRSTKCFEGGARTQLTRLTVDLRAPGGPRVERRKLLQRTVEFPATDPRVTSRPHGVAWYIADAVDDPYLWGPAQSIVRVQLDPQLTVRPSRGASSAGASNGAAGSGGAAVRMPCTPGLAPARVAPGAVAGSAAGAAPGVAVDEWFLGDRTFPGEPMFVPRPGSDVEGDGWLIVGVHNADTERGDVHIFDAQNLSSGPLATIHLPHRLPVSLHGAWHREYTGPDPADPAVPRWQHLGSVKPM
ncbi:hypothetical protein HYH02_002853 [Chlamydomonas schloesseri]|uniref:Carotenoid oxygenase n=1 Tax=Chlamydomonas schloesseri TaxID=2026947 RepID=A0A836BAF3_9CHLO|nr:hypothetical protein HYH02_002853 [Chlamydomonas schloesseri]|eukprot:KAG2452616.1 hypothetical protein HYH02_002853 [Chlamydomonas schloesseri]